MTKRVALTALLPMAVGALAAQSPKPPKHPPPAKKSASAPATPAARTPAAIGLFCKTHCIGCHDGETKAGGLDLTALPFNLDDTKVFAEWVKVNDRVDKGEMPPRSAESLTGAEREPFLKALAAPMIAADDDRARRDGRSIWRRMNRYEYENTLRDLLGAPWLQIRDKLPEDGEAYRFNKVGTALDVSYVQMGRYLTAADYALREAMTHYEQRPATQIRRFYARKEGSFMGHASYNEFNASPERATFLMVGHSADPEAFINGVPKITDSREIARRDQEGVGVVASAYEPLEPRFGNFRAPVSGHYKVRLCANSFWAAPESAKLWWLPSRSNLSAGRTQEPISLYSESPPRQLRKLGSFDVGAEPTTGELDVYLQQGESIRPDAVRLFRSRPPGFQNPLATPQGQPGVVFHYLDVEGPIYDSWPPTGGNLMFGDLPVKVYPGGIIDVMSQNLAGDSERLIRRFLKRAYRRPVVDEDVAPFVNLATKARASGMDFYDTMITVYSAILCSPEFVTLEEKPGPLDDYALATRLSCFLWNSEPDTTLRDLADRGALRMPGVLQAQTDRMLADPRSERFVDAFLDYWLDLRKVNTNSPDAALYPDYYLDDFLTESAADETRGFFAELIKENLPAKNIVDSNFVMVNQRLAELYGLPGVTGTQIRKVELPEDSPRGGLLTQSAVLKVTANGTTTSPVVRGAWITERILGQTVPPPPPNVPAVDPDTRGATTIREQLAKHRTQATCKACHANIDPPGFALENFDVCGGWRDRYRALGDGGPKVAGRGKNGQAFDFYAAQPVDATGDLPDGRHFQDVRDLKHLLLKDDRQIARNLARQLIVYGTGAPVRFGDRPRVEAILDRAKAGDYGVKSIIDAIIQSELFENK